MWHLTWYIQIVYPIWYIQTFKDTILESLTATFGFEMDKTEKMIKILYTERFSLGNPKSLSDFLFLPPLGIVTKECNLLHLITNIIIFIVVINNINVIIVIISLKWCVTPLWGEYGPSRHLLTIIHFQDIAVKDEYAPKKHRNIQD